MSGKRIRVWAFLIFFLILKQAGGTGPIVSVISDEINVRQIEFIENTVIGCTYDGIVVLKASDSIRFIRHPFSGFGLSRICGVDQYNRVWFQADTFGISQGSYISGQKSILVRWDSDKWEKQPLKDSVYAVFAWVDSKGRIWASGTANNYCLKLIADDTVSRFSLPVDSGGTVTWFRITGIDHQNNVWTVLTVRTHDNITVNKLCSFNGEQWNIFDSSNSRLPNLTATLMSFGPDSNCLAFFRGYSSSSLLFIRKNGSWEPVTTALESPAVFTIDNNYSISSIERDNFIKTVSPDGKINYYLKSSIGNTHSIKYDRDGCLWASTDNYELIKICGEKMEKHSFPVLKSSYITSVVRFGQQLVVGTNCGLSVSDVNGWKTFGSEEMGTSAITCLLSDSSKVWLGTSKGLFTYDGKDITIVTGKGCPFNNTTGILSLCKCRDGAIWVGGYQTLARFDGKSWISWGASSEQPIAGLTCDSFRAIVETADGSVWISAYPSGVLRYDGSSFTGYGFSNSQVRLYSISFLVLSPQGELWAVADNSVKYRFSDNRWDTLPRTDDPYFISNPSSDNKIFCKMLPGGDMFISGREGIVIYGRSGRSVIDKYDLGRAYTGQVNDVWVENEDSIFLATSCGLLVCRLPAEKVSCHNLHLRPQNGVLPFLPAFSQRGSLFLQNLGQDENISMRIFTIDGRSLGGRNFDYRKCYPIGSGIYAFKVKSDINGYITKGKIVRIK